MGVSFYSMGVPFYLVSPFYFVPFYFGRPILFRSQPRRSQKATGIGFFVSPIAVALPLNPARLLCGVGRLFGLGCVSVVLVIACAVSVVLVAASRG